jgi:hypothetical protein
MGQASEEIQRRVLQWQDVTAQPHRFGGIEFRLGKRELGHLHGNSLLDVPFPRSVRNELVASGQADHHHIFPDSGWISFKIRSSDDVERAIDLLHRSYEIVHETARRSIISSITALETNRR